MIFVLDDDPTVLRAVAAALRPCGEVRTTSLWSEIGTALVSKGAEEPSLLACDLDMPGIGELEFCRIVRRFNAQIPIIVFTAAPRSVDAALVDVVVDKGQGLEELCRQVQLQLARQGTRRPARPATATLAPSRASEPPSRASGPAVEVSTSPRRPAEPQGEAQIYVLDDDLTVLRAVALALRPLGEVHTASLWSEIGTALIREGAARRQPSLFVCDLEMPGISGIEFCKIVRRHNAAIPIVLFSASSGPIDTALADVVVRKSQGLDELRWQAQALLGAGGAARPGGVAAGRGAPLGRVAELRPSAGVRTVERPSGGVRRAERPSGGVRRAERPSGGVRKTGRSEPGARGRASEGS